MRYYTEISKKDFLQKVEGIMEVEDFPWELPSVIEKDLSKVNFDWENYTSFGEENGFLYPTGYHELKDVLHIYIAAAGSGWKIQEDVNLNV